MAANKSPYPSFVKIFYHSDFAPHVMVIPAHNYTKVDLTHAGAFNNWSLGFTAGDTMIEALIALMAADFPANVVFDRYEIWQKASPTAIPELAFQKVHSVAGSNAGAGWQEAVQKTFFMRATDNSAFKLTLLDIVSDNLFGKYYSLNPTESAIVAALVDPGNAWQSRAGFQPIAFKALTITLNNRLRREYHLR